MNIKKENAFMVLAPLIVPKGRTLQQELELLLSKGYTRVIHKEDVLQIEEYHRGEINP